MSDKKMIISTKKYRGPTEVISLRLPSELVNQLEAIAQETGRTRNEIVQKCLTFSLENIQIEEKK